MFHKDSHKHRKSKNPVMSRHVRVLPQFFMNGITSNSHSLDRLSVKLSAVWLLYFGIEDIPTNLDKSEQIYIATHPEAPIHPTSTPPRNVYAINEDKKLKQPKAH